MAVHFPGKGNKVYWWSDKEILMISKAVLFIETWTYFYILLQIVRGVIMLESKYKVIFIVSSLRMSQGEKLVLIILYVEKFWVISLLNFKLNILNKLVVSLHKESMGKFWN